MTEPSFQPRRVLAWSAVVAVALALIVLLPEAINILFAGFAGLVLGAVLSGLGSLVRRRTGWGRRRSLAVVFSGFAVLLAGFVTWTVLVTAPQVEALAQDVPEALADLRGMLVELGLGQVAGLLAAPAQLLESDSVRSRLFGIFSSGVGAVAGFFVILFIGIYTAIQPYLYVDAMVRLYPPHRRERIRRVAREVGVSLQRWVAGRAFSAGVIGLAIGISVWALGVPLPLSLGVLAALLSFIPNIGPALTVIPAGLLALTVSPTTALVVLGIYGGVQFLESYFLMPLVQEYAIEVPPAALLFTQALFGILFGILGVALAAPILAVGIVLTKSLYVEDRLEAEPEPEGERPPPREAPPARPPAECVPAE
ncbi:MAG TPA: AI-2E family transporter [Sandaracinaceae bacterium LLY-WYZ-13_1]|nr:AI-2E family transporter [Sandaracinaceae bacterium LLY-WYZ-13_1]